MVSLIDNKYPTSVKMKETVSKDPTPVEEVVDLRDDKGVTKTKAGEDWEAGEDVFNWGPVAEMEVAKGGIKGGGRAAGAGADNEGWNSKESCLEEVCRGDEQSMVEMCLKGDNRREGGWLGKEFVLGREGKGEGEMCFFHRPPIFLVLVLDYVELVGMMRWRVKDAGRCGIPIILGSGV
jgi:hypothetical protein